MPKQCHLDIESEKPCDLWNTHICRTKLLVEVHNIDTSWQKIMFRLVMSWLKIVVLQGIMSERSFASYSRSYCSCKHYYLGPIGFCAELWMAVQSSTIPTGRMCIFFLEVFVDTIIVEQCSLYHSLKILLSGTWWYLVLPINMHTLCV